MSNQKNSVETQRSFSSLESEQAKMLNAMACVVGAKSATYISGPITTGMVFVEWYRKSGYGLTNNESYTSELRRNVISENEKKIIEVASSVRASKPCPVIEPASLVVREWDQHSYISFWLQVLEKFVSEMVLVDGWEYSVGCVLEFGYALKNNIAIRSQAGLVMSRESGDTLIRLAVENIMKAEHVDETLIQLATRLGSNLL